MVQVVPMVVVPVVAVERTVTAVPVPVKAAVQMGTGGTEGVDSGSPVVVGVAAGAAGRVARGVRKRNDASVESIEGGEPASRSQVEHLQSELAEIKALLRKKNE